MSISQPDAVFTALGDGNRRQLLAAIADQPSTATELADGLPISRQAVAKHLAALSDAGLVEGERAGREVRYHMTPEPLSDAVGWMATVGAAWDDRLAGLAEAFRGAGGQRRPARRHG